MSSVEEAVTPTDANVEPENQLTGNAGVPRFFAAQIDHGIGIILFFTIAMSLAGTEQVQILPGIAAIAGYLAYYFLTEWLCGATLGKFVCGLRVRQLTGGQCTARQIAIRTALRILEVNILLCGAIPAGISLLMTRRRQRIGDLLAGTVVVNAEPFRFTSPSVRIKRG